MDCISCVNNAGVAILKPVEEFTMEEFDLHTAVNIRAVFAGSKAAIKYLPSGGRIITIGSCMVDRVAGAWRLSLCYEQKRAHRPH